MKSLTAQSNSLVLTPEWERVIRVAESIGHGKLKIVIHEKKPVMIERVVKKIKINDNQNFNERLEAITIL